MTGKRPRKAQVTADQQHHQPPGGKEHQPERHNKNKAVQEPYRMEKVDLLPY